MSMRLLTSVYSALIIVLVLYGYNSLILSLIYWIRRGRPPAPPPLHDLPLVTVQLPMYNEYHTVERLLAAVTALDYPTDKLEIQVLDDSTDMTAQLAEQLVAQYRARGLNIAHLCRDGRDGFKAGALTAGLARARGEFIAVFDADFLPPPDFLWRSLPYFADPKVGCVEGRWGHLNADYSILTEAEAVLLDAHFVIEQPARQAAGAFVSFNGSGGIWRRTCLEAVGGWSADTVTEDLDLSYRAQLAGWRSIFLPDLVVPGELPAQVDAFKRQQSRWAKGSIQTLRKLAWPLVCARQPLWVKVQGLLHLSVYFVQPVALLILLLLPFISLRGGSAPRALSWVGLATLGPLILTVSSQLAQSPRRLRRLRVLPLLLILGAGLSLSNTLAVLEALLGLPNHFERTPKFNLRGTEGDWTQSVYALPHSPLVWAELALSLYAGLSAALMIQKHNWDFLPWVLLYAVGFAYVAGVSLLQSRRRQVQQHKPGTSAPSSF